MFTKESRGAGTPPADDLAGRTNAIVWRSWEINTGVVMAMNSRLLLLPVM
jgi:hypothetical protein